MISMKRYEAMAGDHVNDVARKMVESGQKDGSIYFCSFNDVELYAAPGMSVEAVVAKWQADMDDKARAWQTSPEGIAYHATQAAKEAKNQARHDRAVAELPDRFSDHVSAIKWMLEYVDASSWTYIKGREYWTTYSVFQRSGYMPGDCTGRKEEDYNDPDVMARYVIGQFMSGMRINAVNDNMIMHFGERALKLLEERT